MSLAIRGVTGGVTEAQWEQYERDGYLRLGRVLSDEDLAALQRRIDDIMLGRADVDYDRLLMQLDSADGKYENAGPQSLGFKGATLAYRKIQELEHDPVFRAYMERPLFKSICDQVYGPETPLASFRAMFMNKPARQGTLLPWHQDRWSHLDRDPLITVWTALDPATVANGCVQIIPGSHKYGLINPSHSSGFLTEEQAVEFAPAEKVVYLELDAGEAALLHNWLLHRSDTNATDIPRRAFSVCYMDARTKASNGETHTPLFT
jgi:phytanoyl-CoA hydroxylase